MTHVECRQNTQFHAEQSLTLQHMQHSINLLSSVTNSSVHCNTLACLIPLTCVEPPVLLQHLVRLVLSFVVAAEVAGTTDEDLTLRVCVFVCVLQNKQHRESR